MKALSTFLLVVFLFIADILSSAHIQTQTNVQKAGIADGTWPIWALLFAILALGMYAKAVFSEDNV